MNLSMFLLTISVGRFWSVQSVLEFNAMKKNLRIMSDIEKIFWTVLFRMASRVLVFFTPSDSSLVRNWFVCREPQNNIVVDRKMWLTEIAQDSCHDHEKHAPHVYGNKTAQRVWEQDCAIDVVTQCRLDRLSTEND